MSTSTSTKTVVASKTTVARKTAAAKPAAATKVVAKPVVETVVDEQPAKTVDVVVVGPNLQTKTGETFHVHSPKCADRKRPVYARTDHQNSWDVVESFTSVQALIEDVEQDIMRENDQTFGPGADDFEEYRSEFKIYACVKGLPDREPLTAAQLAEAAESAPKTTRTRRSAVVSVDTLTGADELFWPCAVCKAEQGARCTQRSGRVKTYFHSDRAKSVELFAKYGISDPTKLAAAFADDLAKSKPAVVVEPAKPAAVAKPAATKTVAKPAAAKPAAAKLAVVK